MITVRGEFFDSISNNKIKMINAKTEFLEHISGIINEESAIKVKGAEIIHYQLYGEDVNIYLYGDYTFQDYEDFLTKLDFEYDNGHGYQQIFGNVWYTDGTWSTREEYDGKEWWKHNHCLVFPDYLAEYPRDNEIV